MGVAEGAGIPTSACALGGPLAVTCGVLVVMASVTGLGRCFELRRTGGVPLVAFGVAALPPGACCEERRGWLETRR